AVAPGPATRGRTMKFSEEVLMAYADGELDAATRTEVEAAAASDPELAASLSRHRATRELLRRGFDPVLDEPVPGRLLAALEPEAGRQAGAEFRPLPVRDAPAARQSARRWSWPEWGAMAATLAVGALIGAGLRIAPAPLMETRGDGLI